MRETWYVLEDGRTVDPREVTRDATGALRHSSGVAVAMRGDVPHSRGVDDPEAERSRPAKSQGGGRTKAIKAEDDKPGYKTRETRAD